MSFFTNRAARITTTALLALAMVACGDDTGGGIADGGGGGDAGVLDGGSSFDGAPVDAAPDDASWEPFTMYVTATATGSGDGTEADPFTLAQAVGAVTPGDIVSIAVGDYDISDGLNFNVDGTSGAPIRWIGTMAPADFAAPRADGTASTLIRNITESTNGPIRMSGDHNVFAGIVFQQDFGTPNGSNGRQLISISGDNITWDGVAFKHPTNASSSSNHSIRTSGDPDNLTFRNSHFYRGSRTIIWIQGNTTEAPDNFLMEGCTLTGADNHPPIQIMPYTNLVNPVPINGAILRNNTWIDNSYGGAIYMRHNANFQIYNNVVIRSETVVDLAAHPVAPFANTGPGLIAHNTIVHDGGSYFFYNEAHDGLTVKNNLVISKGALYGDMVIRFGCWVGGGIASPNTGHDFDYNAYYVDTDPDFGDARFRYPSSPTCGDTAAYTIAQWKGLGFDAHTLYGTDNRPTFVNEAADDYRLAAGSIGKNAGTPIPGIMTDRAGNPRSATNPSIGAFE